MNKIKAILVLAVLLSSCTTSSVTPPVASLTPTPTITPLANFDGPTPVSETPTSSCSFPAWSQQAVMPDASALKWETEQMPEGTNYLRLSKLTTPILEAKPSPDGNWWLVEIQLPNPGADDGSAAGAPASALYVMDANGNNHWIASASGRAQIFRRFSWLSDDRLAWIDDNHVQVANANGTGRNKGLTTPEPVRDIRVGAGNLAFAIGETTLWRVNLDTGAWDAVSGLPPVKRPLYDKELVFSLSPDKTFAAAVFSEKFWKIPLAFGAPAQIIADAYPGGTGQWDSWHGPQVLSNTPFWSWYAKPTDAGSSVPFENVLIDTENTQTVLIDSLIPAGEYFSDKNNVSLDGRWLATSLFRKPVSGDPPEQTGLYIAPTSELAKGITIPGSSVNVAGWRTDLPAAIIIQTSQKGDENLRIRQLSLSNGSFTELLSMPPETEYGVLALPGKTLIKMGNALYIFSVDGKKIAEFSMPPGIANTLLGASNSQALIFNVTDDNSSGQCLYTSHIILVNIK